MKIRHGFPFYHDGNADQAILGGWILIFMFASGFPRLGGGTGGNGVEAAIAHQAAGGDWHIAMPADVQHHTIRTDQPYQIIFVGDGGIAHIPLSEEEVAIFILHRHQHLGRVQPQPIVQGAQKLKAQAGVEESPQQHHHDQHEPAGQQGHAATQCFKHEC
ncbi:MAG: hypothetical protein KatS3mg050_2434 [Litorilinea sp.]|nr:MAG: hypothetical protein KatS3mg050_2434 [Litorilinea sp.]